MLSEEITDYIKILTDQYPSIQSIWLIGSRANANFRPDSDWDLLIFGTQKIIDDLSHRREFKKKNIDLLVVYNGNDFKEPWEPSSDNKEIKNGSLSKWKWKEINPIGAMYIARKGIKDNDGGTCHCYEEYPANATRVFP